MDELDPSVKGKLTKLFDTLDTDRSGHISLTEFQEACSRLSLQISKEDLQQFLNADVSGDEQLDLQEFCSFYIYRLRRVFNDIDCDGSGHIDVEELKRAFDKLGYNVTEREVRVLLTQVDNDKSGFVDFKEFCDYFVSLPSPSVRSIIEQWASGLSVDVGTDLAPPPLPPPSIAVWRALLAGGVAGVVSRTVTAPLEKIKLLAQTSSSGSVRLLPTLKSVVKTETWTGLFAGNGVNCLRVLPFSALVCLAYSNMAKHFPLDSSGTAPLWRMGAGAMAGVFATILTHPIDVVRAQLTVQTSTTKGLLPGLKNLYQKEKLRGLYRGLGPTLLSIAPFMAIQQSTYDVLKHQASLYELQSSPLLFLTCGSIAGASAQTVIYPLDVIRRRLQVHGSRQVLSLVQSLSTKQLFAGLSATYLKVMPSAAISLLVRDAILGRLKK